LFDLPDAPRPDPGRPAPVRLVAEFDNLILSHADRTRVISDDDRQRMATPNGIFPGTVLVDGFVAGMWRITRPRGTAVLTVEPFGPLSPADCDAVTSEGRRLLDFAAAGARHEIRFRPAG
jgi:DNA glycosylase AlkZ-like